MCTKANSLPIKENSNWFIYLFTCVNLNKLGYVFDLGLNVRLFIFKLKIQCLTGSCGVTASIIRLGIPH